MSESSYNKVQTVEHALSLAREYSGNYLYFAGGSDIMIYRKQNLADQSNIIDIRDIPELGDIRAKEDSLVIGSAVSLHELSTSQVVTEKYPILSEAAVSIATPVIRKSATIAGNLLVANRCNFYNQSALWRESAGSCLRETGPTCLVTGGRDKCYSRNVSDLAPALIALGANVTIRNQQGTTELPLYDIYNADGICYHNHLEDDAILLSITVPAPPQRYFFRKLRRRGSLDFSSLTMAAAVNGDIARVCLNAVSMSPILLTINLANDILADTQKLAVRSCKTVNNDMFSQKYRRQMISVFLAQFWREMAEKV